MRLFPQRNRLSKRDDISFVRRNGREWRSPQFLVFSLVNAEKYNRVAVLVSRRMGIATVRNRIKRRIREIVRTNDWPGPPCFDFLIIPRRVAESTYFELNSRYQEWKRSVSGS